jgi:superkiller protein 3
LIADATSNIMHFPGQVQGWMELAQVGDARYPAEMTKNNAVRQIPPGGSLDADDLAEVFRISGDKEDGLQVKMLAPWTVDEAPLATS